MIEFREVSKGYGAQEVLRDVSFSINEGERVGVVGPNGAGKTTVFAMIVGDVSPDEGSVNVRKNLRLGYLRQELAPRTVTTPLLERVEHGREDLRNIAAEMETLVSGLQQGAVVDRDSSLERLGALQTRFETGGGYEIKMRAEAALRGLGFTDEDFQRPFGQFSGGWQMRAELARLLAAEPELLLLDEPSNYLDIPAIEWLQKYLKNFRGTFAMISHDRYLLNSLATVTIEVANAEVARYAGNYDSYVTERVVRYEQRVAAARNQDRKRRQVQRFIDRFRAKNTKASQVQSRIKMLDRMEEIAIPRPVVGRGLIRLKNPSRCGHEVARLDGAGLTYDGSRWVLRQVDLRIERGDKIALVGQNGMGKTSLLRLLAGKLPLSEGQRVIGHNVVVGYQSQEFAETMDPDSTVYDTVHSSGQDATDQEIRTLLGGFGFPGDMVEKRVSVLSGGEKVRLAFARLLINPPNFLILDEPTTHLDVTGREALESALHEFEGTICLVAHDIEFVRHVATTIVAMRPPGVERFAGGYDYYCERMAREPAARTDSAPVERASASAVRKAAQRERVRKLNEFAKRRRRLEALAAEAEKRADALTLERDGLVASFRDRSDDTDYSAINRRLTEIQHEMDGATRSWDESTTDLQRLQAECDAWSKQEDEQPT